MTTLADLVEIPVAAPFAGAALLGFLHRHLVAGVEVGEVVQVGNRTEHRYARTVLLPHGPGWVRLVWDGRRLTAELHTDPRDRAAALRGVRHLVDADADPLAVDRHLGADPHLRDLVGATPGLRVPGVLEPAELVFRTVIGQQISLAAARTSAANLAERHGQRVSTGEPGLGLLFPTPEVLAAVDPTTLPMPKARGRALVGIAERIADGRLDLSDRPSSDRPSSDRPSSDRPSSDRPSSDRPSLAETRAALLACPGIGPWTADYVLMRARHAPDILLTSDLVLARELVSRRVSNSEVWSPYRSYAALHLWHDFLTRTAG